MECLLVNTINRINVIHVIIQITNVTFKRQVKNLKSKILNLQHLNYVR